MRKVLFCLMIGLFLCGIAHAETIYFRNGKILKGEIIRRTGVYIRIKPQYGVVEREFLLENIERIVKDGAVTYAREVMGGFEGLRGDSLDELPEDVRLAAEAMAVSLIEEAMRKVDIPSMEDAPEGVRVAAQEKANELLKNAVLSSQEATPAVQFAATEIATALIEESVKKVVVMPSLDQASNQVQEAAREKATALIDEALRADDIGSYEYAPEVKRAAKQKASALIEEAMKEVDVPRIEARSFDTDQVSALMQEAVQKRIYESSSPEQSTQKVNFQEVLNIEDEKDVFVEGQEVVKEQELDDEGFEKEFVPELEVFGEEVAMLAKRAEKPLFTDEDYQMDADAMVSDEVQKAIMVEQQKLEKLKEEAKVSPKQIILGLGVKDYLIIGLIVILLFVLLTQRRVGARKISVDHHDVAISSSLTYQNLPDDLKGRITSSDVTVILKLQAKFQNQVGLDRASKQNKMVIIDDNQMIEYIFDIAKSEGHAYRREDIAKVLEAQDKAIEESSVSKAE